MAAKPTLKQLKYLCAVAETRHFGKAAEACFVAQSTLSAGIHELEQTLGITLLERNNKQVILTHAGTAIVKRARQILTEINDLVAEAQSQTKPLTHSIRLGVIPTIAPFMLPKILAQLRRDHPKLEILIREDLSANIVNQLNQGDLDIILLALPYPMEQVVTEHLLYDDFLLAYPKGHPLGKISKLTTRHLKGQQILLLEEGHCLRTHALEACKLMDSHITLPYQATSLHTIVQMVANHIGVTLLPKMAINSGILAGTDIKIKLFQSGNVQREIGLAWRRHSPRHEEYKILADYFRKTYK